MDAISSAVVKREAGKLMDPTRKHEAVTKMYNWPSVTVRTEKIYEAAMAEPERSWPEGIRK